MAAGLVSRMVLLFTSCTPACSTSQAMISSRLPRTRNALPGFWEVALRYTWSK